MASVEADETCGVQRNGFPPLAGPKASCGAGVVWGPTPPWGPMLINFIGLRRLSFARRNDPNGELRCSKSLISIVIIVVGSRQRRLDEMQVETVLTIIAQACQYILQNTLSLSLVISSGA